MSGSDGSIKIDTLLDSTKAKKGLQEIEKAADSTGKKITESMNNAEKSMNKASSAFDGSKIAKQLSNVSKSIDDTSKKITQQQEKLSKLQDAYKNAGSQKLKDNISTQIEKTTTNIDKLETKLSGFKDKEINLKVKMDSLNDLDGNFHSASMKITEDLDNIEEKAKKTGKEVENSFTTAGDKISKVGDKISGVGDTLNKNVTLPVIGAGAAALKIGSDFDAGMSRVKAIAGATGDEFKQLHDQALQLGADTAFSAKQAAEGMENLASAGFSTNEIMSAMPGLLNLAASSGESLASSSDIAANTLRGFGLAADQTGHVADVLAKNASATNAAVADTGEAMKFISPVAHAMGLSLEEVTAAIGEMANSGIKGSQSGTTLRSALTRLASPSKDAADAMAAIGFNAFDSQGKLKNLSTIMQEYNKALEGKTDQQKQDYTATIFGQEAMSGMMVLMQGGSKTLDDLTNSYKNSDGAAKEMADTMQDNTKSSIEQMFGSLETAAIKIEEDFAPAITEITQDILELANKFSELSPEQQKFYGELLLSAAAAGPLLKIVGGLTSGIGGLAKTAGSVGKFLGLFSTGAEAVTVGAETVGVAGTVAAGGIGAFGTALGGALAAVAPFALGAGAVVAAGYAIDKGLSQEVIPSVDLFADKINVTSKTVQTEYGAMQEAVEGSTVKISDATKQAVQAYLDMDNNSKEAIQDLYINNSTITDQIVSDTKSKFDEMANTVVGGYEKQKDESIKQLNDLFSNEQDLTAEEQADILQKTNDYYSNKESAVQDDESQINQILQNASDEKRSLTADEVSEITSLQNDMRDNSINALSDQESEAAVILQRIKDYDGEMTAEQASEHIQALNDSRDQAVQAANDEYDQRIAAITKMRDETGSITDEQAQIMIDNAKKQRDETVQAAQETRDGAVTKIQEMDGNLENEVNTSTGTILTYWDKLVNWWNSWNPPKKTFSYDIAGGSTTVDKDKIDGATYNPYASYTGTNSRKGLSYVNEHGYETAKGSNVKMINPGLAYISSHATGGDGINDHMTTVNEMHNDITNQVNNSFGNIVNALISAMTGQSIKLDAITTNTSNTVSESKKGNQLNEKLATSVIGNIKSQTSGNFSNLQNEINTANATKEKASNMKIEDNYWYSSSKAQLDDISSQIDALKDQSKDLDSTITSSSSKEAKAAVDTSKDQIEAQQRVLEKQKDTLQSTVDYYKDAAQKEIETVKDQADQEVKIAEDKKAKLTQLAEAVTTAIKNELSAQETASENSINSRLTTLENNYNKKVAALDKETTETSRQDTLKGFSDQISVLEAKMKNTASYADKQAYQLQIDDINNQKDKQQDEWSTDDKKKALEEEYNDQKESLEKQLQNTKDYYSKLQEEDSINAQARYLLLNGNSQDLVELLNSYNPQWQDAGQSLADSLINGLNSQQQSVQDAVDNLIGSRGASQSYYYNEKGQKVSYSTGQVISGYATGTNNATSGLHYTDEQGFEMNTKGNVAYVSQGAAIKNHMQTQSYIDSLVATEISSLKASLIQSQQDTIKSMFGSIGGTNNSITHNNGNTVNFTVQGDYNQNAGQDLETTANELGFYAFKQQTV